MMGFGIGPTWRALLRKRSLYVAVVLQIGIGFAIVVQSTLLAREFLATAQQATGWDQHNVVLVTAERYDANSDALALRARDLAALEKLDGVDGVEVVSKPPQTRRDVADYLVTREGTTAQIWSISGGPRLTQVLGAQLVAGRAPVAADLETTAKGGPIAAVLSAPLVTVLWPGATADQVIGRTLSSPSRGRDVVVVGVVATAISPAPFMPLCKQTVLYAAEIPAQRRAHFVVHVTPGRTAAVIAAAHDVLAAHDPDRWTAIRTLDEQRRHTVRNAYGAPRIIWTVNAIVIGVMLFGSLGMASFLVTERTRQIGIRRALGARRDDIVGYFLVENFLVTTVGLAIGLPLNMLLHEVLLRFGSHVQFSGWVLVAAAFKFWVIGLIAALVPALRASRIPPVVASKGASS
jgi:putative ABC transport system permease protein